MDRGCKAPVVSAELQKVVLWAVVNLDVLHPVDRLFLQVAYSFICIVVEHRLSALNHVCFAEEATLWQLDDQEGLLIISEVGHEPLADTHCAFVDEVDFGYTLALQYDARADRV